MVNRMVVALDQAYLSVISEKDLRRQIDHSVSRALVDEAYARLLLTDPTVILGDRGCPPQQYLSLRSIQASTLFDFACQAYALFWAPAPYDELAVAEEDPISVPAAVS
jgi:hypothetical protein